ncbi:PREDICTED: inactive GDSL esterase/lipase-like protein 25 [Tarenaya hassleriana]|uniref:inactive GDSL esterase/lipase-like protein 25 n=1 Tax=Tarenaya hassleriana TaxID=28532 RepID=UPI00053C4E19|nr:PREDICTED: inactive GDSL esterase/lipase-like protein 25 [Tarenaya hassleriana]
MAHSNFRFFSLILFTVSLLHLSTTSRVQTLFIFGDDFYDVGNKQFLAGNLIPANAHPYGVAIRSATGRWSDGLVVPNYLAEFMGIPRISSILDSKSDFSHGASFSIAGATVLGSPPETMKLEEQVMKFHENKKKWSDKELSQAIYLFYIGGEDYLDFAKNNLSPSNDQKHAFVDQVISAIDSSIKGVYESGGRKFAFQNLAPLGCLPNTKQELGEGRDKCLHLPSEMAALHNKKLLQLLNKQALELKGFQFSFYDFFTSLHNRVVLPNTYAFTTGNAACCGTGPYNGSGCMAKSLCAKPQAHIFFDGKHLTQEANSQIDHLMWGATPEVVGPHNLRELMSLPSDIPVVFCTDMDNRSDAITHDIYGMGTMEFGGENHVEGADSFIM